MWQRQVETLSRRVRDKGFPSPAWRSSSGGSGDADSQRAAAQKQHRSGTEAAAHVWHESFDRLHSLARGEGDSVISLPSALTATDREHLHKICNKLGLKSKSYGSAPRSFEAWRRGAKAGENQDGDEVPDQVCYDTGMMDSRWTSAQSRSARRRGQCAPWISSSMRRGRREVAGGPWERVVADRSADPALRLRHPAAPAAAERVVP